MADHQALWVSTSTHTRGGIATYVRAVQETAFWDEWSVQHVSTHRDGSKVVKLATFLGGAALFMVQLIRLRPNVVHLHSSADASFIRKATLFWMSRVTGVPVVLHIHGSSFHEYFAGSSPLVQAVIRSTLLHASAVVALGETWAERLRSIAPGARVVLVPNAVRVADEPRQPETGQSVGVVFLGRIGDRKGTFRLLDAWARLGERSATLTIAGDGEVDRARQRIDELGLDDSVDLFGWLPQSQVGELLDRADVLVLPSLNEGQPMAVLEAMARGLCVIAGDSGGLPEMVGEGCGVLVSAGDVDAIEKALKDVIEDPELRDRYGAAAYARARERYDVDVVSRQLDALYREVAR